MFIEVPDNVLKLGSTWRRKESYEQDWEAGKAVNADTNQQDLKKYGKVLSKVERSNTTELVLHCHSIPLKRRPMVDECPFRIRVEYSHQSNKWEAVIKLLKMRHTCIDAVAHE